MMIFSIVAMTGLEKCCITSAYLQWLCHSGERPVALLFTNNIAILFVCLFFVVVFFFVFCFFAFFFLFFVFFFVVFFFFFFFFCLFFFHCTHWNRLAEAISVSTHIHHICLPREIRT